MYLQKQKGRNVLFQRNSKLFFIIFIIGFINYDAVVNASPITENVETKNLNNVSPLFDSKFWYDYELEYGLEKYSLNRYKIPNKPNLTKKTYKTLLEKIKSDFFNSNISFTADTYLQNYKMNIALNELVDIFYYHVNEYNLKDLDFTQNVKYQINFLFDMLNIDIITNKNDLINKTDYQNKEFNKFKIHLNQNLLFNLMKNTYDGNIYSKNF